MPIPAKHSPALAAHNLRNRLEAAKKLPDSGMFNVVTSDLVALLKERDGLVMALKSCEATLLYGLEYGPKGGLLPVVQAALASARGQA